MFMKTFYKVHGHFAQNFWKPVFNFIWLVSNEYDSVIEKLANYINA